MSEPENFLARWSRRKQQAEQEKEPHSGEQNPSARPRESGDPGQPGEQAESAALDSRLRGNERGIDENKEPEIDLSKLPSLEEIGADTDITAFLQRGVPADLTRAALRRVWASDPTIRDFIGIAENQYDFATGDGIPGFGPLKAVDDVRRMLADITREGMQAMQTTEAEPTPAPAISRLESDSVEKHAAAAVAEEAQLNETESPTRADAEQEAASTATAEAIVQREEKNVALQNKSAVSENEPAPDRRPHGRALPQ